MQFNIQNVDPSPSFDLIPPGYYPALIDKAEAVEPKKNPASGTMAKLEYVIYDENSPYNGRRVWEYLTINHDDPKVRSIALGKLARICHAIGNPNASDLSDIVGGVLLLKIGIEKGKEGYEDGNNVKDHKPMANAKPAATVPAPAAPAAPASPRKAWGKPS